MSAGARSAVAAASDAVPRAAVKPWALLALVLMVAAGAWLRVSMVAGTALIEPVRADAAEYYAYAYNLRHHGVYSKSIPGTVAPEDLRSDRRRPPGYALFLLPFVDGMPTLAIMRAVQLAQVVLSVLTVVVVFAALSPVLGSAAALGSAALVSLSPHLVAVNVYLLSESLFVFCIAAIVALFSGYLRAPGVALAVALGLAIGASALVRPTMNYFVPFAIAYIGFAVAAPRRWRDGCAVLLGFAVVYLPWAVWSAFFVDVTGENSLAIDSVHNGLYLGFMYDGVAESYGRPYAFVPDFDQVQSWGEVLRRFWERFSERPFAYLAWYLFEKPWTFLSWNIIQGQGDVFIYPVATSPFHTAPVFQVVHALAYGLHWPLTAFALAGAVFAFASLRRDGGALLAGFLALVLGYFIALHAVATPLPRYGIPTRIVVYPLAIYAITRLGSMLSAARAARRG